MEGGRRKEKDRWEKRAEREEDGIIRRMEEERRIVRGKGGER